MSDERKIYIEELAERLERAAHTCRQWLRRDDFPSQLKPVTEGGRKKLYWTEDQMPGLIEYAEQRASLRGTFGRAKV